MKRAVFLLAVMLWSRALAEAQYAGGTGGTVTTSGGYTIHTFTSSGTFSSSGNGNVEVLVVAGGGGGGNGGGAAAGGGGGGGVLLASPVWVTAQSYTVTVGGGGAGSTDYEAAGQNGGNSVFGASLTAVGGGGGGSHGGYAGGPGVAGGSGGGSGGRGAGGGALAGGSGTSGQGSNGGTGSNGGSYTSGGGGGGAGAVGGNGSNGGSGTSGNGGAGGVGIASSINGTSTYYGGGGGGARDQYTGTYGAGGNGGGGHGEKRDGAACVNGTANTGGGGGGQSVGTPCSGGSGVVIVRYPTAASSGGSGSTTIYFKRDTLYAGPGGGAIATVTPPPSDATAPSAPSSLGTTSTTATSVALSWTGSTDSGGSSLAGYKIYRQKGSGANLPVGSVNSSTTAFTDQPLEPNTSYTYTIVAFDNAQNHSSASNSVNPTTSTTSGDATAPTVPGGLSVVLTGYNSVLVRWVHSTDTGGSGMKGYKVYRDGSVVSGSNPIAATFFAQTGLAYGTQYGYKVEAWDNNNNVSSQTSTVNITTAPQVLFRDDFNRFDSSTLGSPWTPVGNNDYLQVVGSEATNVWDGTAEVAASYMSPGTDSFIAGMTLKNVGASPSLAALILYKQGDGGFRVQNNGEIRRCDDVTDGSFNCGQITDPRGTFSFGGSGVIEVTADASAGTISVNGNVVVEGISSGEMTGPIGFLIKDANPSSNPTPVVQSFWLVAP